MLICKCFLPKGNFENDLPTTHLSWIPTQLDKKYTMRLRWREIGKSKIFHPLDTFTLRKRIILVDF